MNPEKQIILCDNLASALQLAIAINVENERGDTAQTEGWRIVLAAIRDGKRIEVVE